MRLACVFSGEDVFVNEPENADCAQFDTERLVQLSQAGSRGAFDKLVRMHQHRATKLAIRITGDAHEAAEAVQDGFMAAFVKIEKLRDPGKFEAWLLRIVANAAISRLRACKRRIDRVRLADCKSEVMLANDEDNRNALELKQAIQRAMMRLSKKEAMAISLFALDGLSHKEAAEIMGGSEGAVRWHVHKARGKLRRLLKDYL